VVTETADTHEAGRTTAVESLSVVALGAGRLVRRWPGLLAVPVSYGIAGTVLYDSRYGYIVSAVIAFAVGFFWYASPSRRIEERWRKHADSNTSDG